jgi:hypothetical protein
VRNLLELDRRLGVDRHRRGLICDKRAILEPQDAPRVMRDVLVMGHHHNRAAGAVELLEQRKDSLPRATVERAGWLVSEDQRGIADERARDRHSLLLAAGQLAGPMAHPVREADRLERGARAEVPFRAPQPGIYQRHLHVFERRIAGEQIIRLEHKADATVAQSGQLIVIELCRVLARENEPSRCRAIEQPDEIHQCRFA